MKLANIVDWFAAFLRGRRWYHHFRRLPLWESVGRSAAASSSPPPALTSALRAAASDPPADVLARLGSDASGLDAAQVRAQFARYGPNAVVSEPPLSWVAHLWRCYANPFNLLLTVLAGVSWLTGDREASVVIAAMVLLSVGLRFVQEMRSHRDAEALKALVSSVATVSRRPAAAPADQATWQTVPLAQVVPGDVIRLSAGDMIPGDCRLLTAKDLFIAQAAMTGESMPVEKHAVPPAAAAAAATPETPLFDLAPLCFMGTNVISGAAEAVVLSTGAHTFFGALAHAATTVDRAPTAFEVGVNRVSWLLIRFMLVMAPLVLIINGVGKGDWLQALLFALSIAVGLTPEMLPMIVTSTLAKGAVFLSRQQVIVKRLDAIQNFGAMDVLCTDKTGTLTEDQIVLAHHVDAWGADCDEVLELAYLNSYFQTGLSNLLDAAVLKHTELALALDPAHRWSLVDEVPWDFGRRRMSVIVSQDQQAHRLICKGAVEEMLAVCTHVRRGAERVPLDAPTLAQVHEVTVGLNQGGMRVVAVATDERPVSQTVFSAADEQGLTLVGYVAFLDPPKPTTAPALAALDEHGVRVKVLTGDNELVAARVCEEVGLATHGALLGPDLDALDDAQLQREVEAHNLFAKLTPAHKDRIVRALRANGRVVGFLGDGINDAPALRAADIGISVDTAVDIAKEAADIILLAKDLMVLEQGVREGRRTFANLLKYIKITASSNFGNVFSVLIASAMLPFLPMLPMHLLIQNFLYDLSQTAIPFDRVDEELIVAPQRWNPADIGRFMLFFGPLSSVFDLLTFALLWYVYHANSVAHQSLFQSGWFVVGLVTQTLIVHLIRTPRRPFIDSRASRPLLVMSALIITVGLWLPQSALAAPLRFTHLPISYFGWLLAIVVGYTLLVQALKGFYERRWGWQ